MNNLIVTTLYPPTVGGAAIYNGDTVPRLARCNTIDRLTLLTEWVRGQPRETADGKLLLLRHLPTRASSRRRRWLSHAATYFLTQTWLAVRLPDLVR